MDINEYTNDSLRRSISYVPQNIELFSKSIYDNIRVSKVNAILEEVREAAKAADAHDFIKKLPVQQGNFVVREEEVQTKVEERPRYYLL